MKPSYQLMMAAGLIAATVNSADIAKAGDSGSMCDYVRIDMDRGEVIQILNEHGAKYKTESLAHLYDQREPEKDDAKIPELIAGSYPVELIFGSTKGTQGGDFIFVIGVRRGGRIGAVACSRVFSP